MFVHFHNKSFIMITSNVNSSRGETKSSLGDVQIRTDFWLTWHWLAAFHFFIFLILETSSCALLKTSFANRGSQSE